MNSFATREESLAALAATPSSRRTFRSTSSRTRSPSSSPRTWSPSSGRPIPTRVGPPGHGDLYTALVTSGMLERAARRAATPTPSCRTRTTSGRCSTRASSPGSRERIPFVMEVADRTARPQGRPPRAPPRRRRLVLREIAQTPEEDLDSFQDISRHRFFNTNTLWIDLRALARRAARARQRARPADDRQPQDGRPDRPVARPRCSRSRPRWARRSSVFDGARALRVPRARFAPVKTTNDLLVLRSDAYVLDRGRRTSSSPRRRERPAVRRPRPGALQAASATSRRASRPARRRCVECERFVVRGDVRSAPASWSAATSRWRGLRRSRKGPCSRARPWRRLDREVLDGRASVALVAQLVTAAAADRHLWEQRGHCAGQEARGAQHGVPVGGGEVEHRAASTARRSRRRPRCRRRRNRAG